LGEEKKGKKRFQGRDCRTTEGDSGGLERERDIFTQKQTTHPPTHTHTHPTHHTCHVPHRYTDRKKCVCVNMYIMIERQRETDRETKRQRHRESYREDRE
jgi:hypothetical protein